MPLNLTEPESAGRLNPRDVIGHLLLVWAVDYIPHSPTKFTRPGKPGDPGYKPSDVVVVDVVDLDLDDPLSNLPGLVTRGAWWRPSRLIQALRNKVGNPDPTFAWMSTGTSSQGMNAPYVLVPAVQDPEAVRRAREWESRNPDFQPSAGAPQQPYIPEKDPEPQPEQTPQERQRTYLERLARTSREGAERLPDPPAEDIPF